MSHYSISLQVKSTSVEILLVAEYPSQIFVRCMAIESRPCHDRLETGTNATNSGHTEITKQVRIQAHTIDRFWMPLSNEYLTALREHHRKTGSNSQTIRVGAIVQVHDDCPRMRWKLAVVEELMTGRDRRTRAAKIPTNNRLNTTRPTVKLYPLEVLNEDQRL